MKTNNKVQEQCFDIIRLNRSFSFTAEKLFNHTGFSVRRIKYNVNLLIKRGFPIAEGFDTQGSYAFSTGYYFFDPFPEMPPYRIWWNGLSETEKWNLTINHIKHWTQLEEHEIQKLYEN